MSKYGALLEGLKDMQVFSEAPCACWRLEEVTLCRCEIYSKVEMKQLWYCFIFVLMLDGGDFHTLLYFLKVFLLLYCIKFLIDSKRLPRILNIF